MFNLSQEELRAIEKIANLKEAAGSHSPSLRRLSEKLSGVEVKIDSCFLSNPYATEVFQKCFALDFKSIDVVKSYVEFYPAQNRDIAESLSDSFGVSSNKLFIGNGATEIIQAIIHYFTTKKIVINLPTFSPYYEFAKEGIDVRFFRLEKQNNFKLDLEKYINFVKNERPDTIVLINPNNPDGSYLNLSEVRTLLESLRDVANIIVDISFIHFALESQERKLIDYREFFSEFSNLIVIKSMSKDFGVAGLRAAYAVMEESKVSGLLKYGYLWNTNAFAEYFFSLCARPDFMEQYFEARLKYLAEKDWFEAELRKVDGIKVYPSHGNFYLIELMNGLTSTQLVSLLLIRYGIYVRDCADKIGLDGSFVRIACRSHKENKVVCGALAELLGTST